MKDYKISHELSKRELISEIRQSLPEMRERIKRSQIALRRLMAAYEYTAADLIKDFELTYKVKRSGTVIDIDIQENGSWTEDETAWDQRDLIPINTGKALAFTGKVTIITIKDFCYVSDFNLEKFVKYLQEAYSDQLSKLIIKNWEYAKI